MECFGLAPERNGHAGHDEWQGPLEVRPHAGNIFFRGHYGLGVRSMGIPNDIMEFVLRIRVVIRKKAGSRHRISGAI